MLSVGFKYCLVCYGLMLFYTMTAIIPDCHASQTEEQIKEPRNLRELNSFFLYSIKNGIYKAD